MCGDFSRLWVQLPVLLQPLGVLAVQVCMSDKQSSLLLLCCLVALGACASGERLEPQSQRDIEEISRTLGCAEDEIAFCIDVDCEPDEFRCVDKSSVRDLFRPQRPRRKR